MKEARFITLLNLYIDREISPSESVELETELRANPARRRTYMTYCRMQKACDHIFSSEQSSAPASFALQRAIQQAGQRFEVQPARRRIPAYAWGSFAAVGLAACVAFVVVNRQGTVTPELGSATTVAAVETAPAATNVRPAASNGSYVPVEAFATQPRDFTPVLTAANLSAMSRPRASTLVAANHTTEQSAQDYGWMREMSLPTIQRAPVESLLFSQEQAGSTESNTYGSHQPYGGVTEFTAFQFQR